MFASRSSPQGSAVGNDRRGVYPRARVNLARPAVSPRRALWGGAEPSVDTTSPHRRAPGPDSSFTDQHLMALMFDERHRLQPSQVDLDGNTAHQEATTAINPAGFTIPFGDP